MDNYLYWILAVLVAVVGGYLHAKFYGDLRQKLGLPKFLLLLLAMVVSVGLVVYALTTA
jgi:hypothetical protein